MRRAILRRSVLLLLSLLFACGPSVQPALKDMPMSEPERIASNMTDEERKALIEKTSRPMSDGTESGGASYIDLGVATFHIPSNIAALLAAEAAGGVGDLNCDDVSSSSFAVGASDPNGFDGDNDGIGCE